VIDQPQEPSNKSILRASMRRDRRTLVDRPARSLAIWDAVVALDPVVRAARILLFDTIPGEPETAPFAAWCRSNDKQVARPHDDVDPRWPDVVIVPGLAFTASGHRLGQGGGWYDRFLAQTRVDCIAIGVGFDLQIVDELPIEAHDVQLDRVVTESGPTLPGGSTSR
jgi:5-formyltetrahydrofolate cyclo-ligase